MGKLELIMVLLAAMVYCRNHGMYMVAIIYNEWGSWKRCKKVTEFNGNNALNSYPVNGFNGEPLNALIDELDDALLKETDDDFPNIANDAFPNDVDNDPLNEEGKNIA